MFAIGSFNRLGLAEAAVATGVLDERSGMIDFTDSYLLPNPSYVKWHGQDRLHVLLENTDEQAGIATFKVGHDGRLDLLDRHTLAGSAPCHVGSHPDGLHIAITCYASGDIIVLELGADGVPTRETSHTRHQGSSKNVQRQTEAHPHSAIFSPDGHWLLVPDLGTDEIRCYPFDRHSGSLGIPVRNRAAAGSGPRVGSFIGDRDEFILIHELSCRLGHFKFQDGHLRLLEDFALLERSPTEADTGAGLRVAPDISMLATSIRGEDVITLFRIKDATLIPDRTFPSGGRKPRDFDFSPSSNWLVCANQASGQLTTIALTGTPEQLESYRDTAFSPGSPSCIRFAPAYA